VSEGFFGVRCWGFLFCLVGVWIGVEKFVLLGCVVWLVVFWFSVVVVLCLVVSFCLLICVCCDVFSGFFCFW